LSETVQHMIAHGLVRDCLEQPFDDALIELLSRQAAELGQLFEARANWGKT